MAMTPSQIIDKNSKFYGAEKIYVLVNKLGNENFFGRIVLSFQSGKIISIRKEETIKPEQI